MVPPAAGHACVPAGPVPQVRAEEHGDAAGHVLLSEVDVGLRHRSLERGVGRARTAKTPGGDLAGGEQPPRPGEEIDGDLLVAGQRCAGCSSPPLALVAMTPIVAITDATATRRTQRFLTRHLPRSGSGHPAAGGRATQPAATSLLPTSVAGAQGEQVWGSSQSLTRATRSTRAPSPSPPRRPRPRSPRRTPARPDAPRLPAELTSGIRRSGATPRRAGPSRSC